MTMPTDGFHHAETAPTSPHPTTKADMDKILEHAIARLKSLGATEDQAVQFITDNGTEMVRSESDGMLKEKLADAIEVVPDFDPADYKVPEVVEYVTEHPETLAEVLALEAAGKARKTLIEELTELSTPAEVEGGDSPSVAGVEDKTE